MSTDRDQLIKQVFQDASDWTGEDRARFLSEACRDDADLRRAVERLLLADQGGVRFLDGGPIRRSSHFMPTQIGCFRVIRMIGQGGMGAVFEAEQSHPQRKVALKMVRHAVLSETLLRRFEYEVQILGQLRHPGIAQIYEAGTFDDGTGPIPYFAMEYVHGWPLLDFARDRRMTVRQRLELMAEVCGAVHHAHQKGVIHRDLKPANILIETDGNRTQPKILDFGVARAVHSDVQLVTMHTEVGQLVGTLAYMSPEQVAGRPDELDIRSDVYTLGVILYELLANRLPYDLRGNSIPNAGGVISEQDPTRLSSIDISFRGEVETIVNKALAKERERRYQSAAELADDIRRFLNDEPIAARPATRAYQWKMFARRNKGLVSGVAAAFVVLLLGITGVSLALIRATRAERAALRSAQKATAVSSFLQNMLAGVDPQSIGPDALTVREVLDQAAERLQRELTDQPDIAAALHQTLGEHYSTLSLYSEAGRHLQKAVELRRSVAEGDTPELADALISLAGNLHDSREIAAAEVPMREALNIRRRLFNENSPELATSMHGMAYILIELGRAQEAEPLVRKSLDCYQQPEHTAVATSTLGWCMMMLGRLDEAESSMHQAVHLVRQLPGDNELVLAGRLTFLSDALRAQGKYVEEEAAIREAVEIRSRRLTADHPALGWNLFCLAQVQRKLGALRSAEVDCRRALHIYLKKRGRVHDDTADCYQLLAQILEDQGRFAEAEPIWNSCLEIRRQLLPPGHHELTLVETALQRNTAAGLTAPKSAVRQP